MLFYYSLVALVLCLAGPILLLSAKRRSGLAQKLGAVPASFKQQTGRPAVWFHAVSVGEFNAVWPLVQAFSERHPEYSLFISTTTATGQKLAQERVGADHRTHTQVFYFPLDLPWATNAWLDALRPSLVAIVETEIWPGFTHECSLRKIPLVVVNARISPRSFTSYHRLRHFFGPVIRQFSAIAAQSGDDAERYRAIAGEHSGITITGNLKYDGLKPISEAARDEVKSRLRLLPDQIVIVAGSTHEGEEQAVLAAFRKLIETRRDSRAPMRLVVVPRHPERFSRVADLITEMGFRPRRYSAGETFEEDNDVFLLDTIGQLFNYYSVASMAFVGGTLAPIGGHNLLEPYAFGVPVVCGPHVEKTLDTARGLTSRQAILMVNNADELAGKLIELSRSAELRSELGERGQVWLAESQGAVGRTVKVLESILGPHYNDDSKSARARADGAKKT